MTSNITTMGERIRIRRLTLNISQAQLAAKVGVSTAAVSQWESGYTKGLKPGNLLATADALKSSIRWLISGKEKQLESSTKIQEPEPHDYNLCDDEKEFILSFRRLSRESQLSLFAFVNSVSR